MDAFLSLIAAITNASNNRSRLTSRASPSIHREAIQQAVAAGALEVGLRAAAFAAIRGGARGVRRIPRFRGVVIAQPDAVGVPEHRRALRAARPVLAGAVALGRERRAVRL